MMASIQTLHAWIQAVNAGDLESILGLYAEDSVLLATFAPRAIRRAEDRRAYFTRLASRPGLRVSLHERTVREQAVGAACEVVSGIYKFEMEIDDEQLVFEARFTMVINPTAARPILHHHSSQIPRTLA